MSLFHKKILPDYLKPDENGWTALHEAAWNGQLDQVMAALEASGEKLTPDHFLIKDNDGKTPLYWAARCGHLDQVMAALEGSGEKLTLDHFLIKDHDGWTPLHGAAMNGYLDQVMAALEASGEKLRQPSHSRQRSALRRPGQRRSNRPRSLTLDHFLIKDHNGRTPLHEAARNGHLDQVFIPSYWTGRVNEMIDLWDQVPQEYREKAEKKDPDYFQKLRDEAIDLSARSAPKLDLEVLSEAMRAKVSPAGLLVGGNLVPVQVK